MSLAQAPRWEYDGRYYLVWKVTDVSERDGYGWELEDVGPSPGRGIMFEIFKDDANDEFTFTAFTDRPMPFELVHRFLTEAARGISEQ